MARAGEADLLRDEGEWPACRRQEEARALDPATDDVLVRGSAGSHLEQAGKVVRAEVRHPGDRVEREIFGEMVLDVRGHAPEVGRGETGGPPQGRAPR